MAEIAAPSIARFDSLPRPQARKNKAGEGAVKEAPPAVDPYAEKRQKMRAYLGQEGEILPPDHEFTQLVQQISQKLGVPEHTEIMVVDTEESNAFFDPVSRTIALSRGFCRYFLEQELPLTEDHIAAVLGHELEHAEVIGDEYVARIQSSFLERMKSMQNHAEEYRADMGAMRRLSKAGYNPRAMIEMLRGFSLTLGRNDLGHPEQIERIRSLENRLVDDEHPLSNTSKELTPIHEDLLEWVKTDSRVYDATEQLIRSSGRDLEQELQAVETQEEFWKIFQLKKHKDKISATKAFVAEESQQLERLATKLMVYQAFNYTLMRKNGGISSDEFQKLTHTAGSFSDGSKIVSLFRSSEFRNSIPPEQLPEFSYEGARQNLATVEDLVERAIQNCFDSMDYDSLSDDDRQFYEKLQRCFESGQASQELFFALYSSHDFHHQMVVQQEEVQRSQQRGLRAPSQSTSHLIDFRNADERARVMEQTHFALAERLLEMPEPSAEIIELLGSTIAHDTGLQEQEAGILARTILKGESAEAWVEYLQQQDKESLKKIIQRIGQVRGGASDIHLSPLRSFHQSYLRSDGLLSHLRGYRYASGVEYGLDAGGLTAINMLAAREFYLRGYPPGFEYNFDQRLSPAQINLTMEEWDLAVEGKANHGTYTERAEWALVKYLDQVGAGVELDSQLVEYARMHAEISHRTLLTPDQIHLMIQNSLWENTAHQVMVNSALKNWFESKKPEEEQAPFSFNSQKIARLSEEDREEIVGVLRETHALFQANPAEKEKIRYGEVPKPEKIASRLLDVLTQDKEATGIPPSQASLQALQQMIGEGVLVDYASISKETIEHIGEYSSEDVREIVRMLKISQGGADKNRQDLIENFHLLSLVSDADRKEVAQQPINEVSIKAILSTHGDNSVEWVAQNFQQSDLRDVILIGLSEFSNEDQKERFDSQVMGLLTEHPDAFKARDSSGFAFELYLYDRGDEGRTQDDFMGQGKMVENFPDLLKRRHSFTTLSSRPQNAGHFVYQSSSGRDGSLYQRYIGKRLLKNEPIIFNQELPFDQRVSSLVEAAPYASVVRDIHVEMLMQEELSRSSEAAEKVQVGRALLPFFTEKSSLKRPLQIQVFQAELAARPQVKQDFTEYINLLTQYMPEPSLARNSFLHQFENETPLTVEQLRDIASLRMSPEGKKTEDDDAPEVFVINKLGELNREERVKATLWLLGMRSEKPKAILQMERDFDGHLNSLPLAIAAGTDDEREVTYKKLFLGAEGIIDLEAVSADQIPESEAQRQEFIQVLASSMLPDTMPNAELFRKIFTTVIESSDPPHASRILVKLINKLSEAKIQGKELPPEEVIAIGLNELGVVGKKVSQSLAELEWVPDSYKKTLGRAQTEGEVVSKRALLMLAEDAGLTDERSPIHIRSFDSLIGAASNKQAALLTVEVNDEGVGLPKGSHQVVGKFKRPSAQKMENIHHDLRVLKGILESLRQEGQGEVLPRDFSAKISDAVKKELDFTQEKQFNEDIRGDLESRNSRREFAVSIPTIYYASDDVMIESVAPGISLRQYTDLRTDNKDQLAAEGYGGLSEKDIHQTVVSEALSQLITTGNVHADLHPGNIFVDQAGNLTLIDLGMHERLDERQRLNTISLITGLLTGKEAYVKATLKEFGWDLGDMPLRLQRFNFSENTAQLFRASQRANTAPSELLGSIILATSKLTTYTQGSSKFELFQMLVGSVNKKETLKIVSHLREQFKSWRAAG